MKQIIPDGPRIKTLRLGLERNATQKELAYAVRVSERKLRQIENESVPISVATMELLAKNLGVHREQITVRQSALQLVAADGETVFDTILSDLRKDRLVPRFDYDLANVTMDEGVLFKEASHVHDFVCEIMVPLNEETGGYAEELIAILTSPDVERTEQPGSPDLGRGDRAPPAHPTAHGPPARQRYMDLSYTLVPDAAGAPHASARG